MPVTGDADAAIDACVDRFVRDHHCVGLAVGIVRDQSTLTTYTRGRTSSTSRRPVDTRSVFRAGSITKLFAAIAVMQLVQDGALDLDDPVGDHLRQFEIRSPTGAAPITLRHLLTHTSGIGELRHPTDLFRPVIGMGSEPGRAMPSLGEYYAPAIVVSVPPNDRWAYANHGFGTLGAVIEDVTGESFTSRLRRTILDPLGMDHSDLVRSAQVGLDLCDGHGRRWGRPRTARHLEVIPPPAGSLYTCIDDMAAFITMVCTHGSPVLDADIFGQMVSPLFRLHAGLPAMGLAFMIDDVHGHREVLHDGGLPGFISHLRVAPDEGLGVVIFSNSASQSIALAIASFGAQLLEITRKPNEYLKTVPRTQAESTPGSPTRDFDPAGCYGELTIRSFIGPIHAPHLLRPVGSHDLRLFDLDLGSSTVRIAFDTDAIHLGLPLNITMRRRAGSFRRRMRWFVGFGATLALAAAIAFQRRQH